MPRSVWASVRRTDAPRSGRPITSTLGVVAGTPGRLGHLSRLRRVGLDGEPGIAGGTAIFRLHLSPATGGSPRTPEDICVPLHPAHPSPGFELDVPVAFPDEVPGIQIGSPLVFTAQSPQVETQRATPTTATTTIHRRVVIRASRMAEPSFPPPPEPHGDRPAQRDRPKGRRASGRRERTRLGFAVPGRMARQRVEGSCRTMTVASLTSINGMPGPLSRANEFKAASSYRPSVIRKLSRRSSGHDHRLERRLSDHILEQPRRGQVGPHGTEGGDQIAAPEHGEAQPPGPFPASHQGRSEDGHADGDHGEQEHHPGPHLVGVPQSGQADGGRRGRRP